MLYRKKCPLKYFIGNFKINLKKEMRHIQKPLKFHIREITIFRICFKLPKILVDRIHLFSNAKAYNFSIRTSDDK